MQKATATYIAPVGDNKVVEMGGVTFFDGKPVDLNSYEHEHLISKLQGSQYFDIKVGEDDKHDKPPAAKKRGRPSAADRAAAKAAAEEADRKAKDAADKAKEAKEDHEATEKAASAKEPAGQLGPPVRTQSVKAGITEAGDHDFEADRRANLAAHAPKGPAQNETGPNQTIGQKPKGA